MVLRGLDQGADVLWKARAPKTRPGMQKLRSDPVVEPDAAGNLLHIGPNLFAQICDLIDEGDLCRQERIGGVFDEFSGPTGGVENRRLIEVERTIDFRHDL